jgi:ABC-type uncharacterized transport system substrate-binding protein
MMQRLLEGSVRAMVAAAVLAFAAGSAAAHPHVFVTIKSELIYANDGSITGVRHAWTFDDMFSTFATQGLESKQKGVFTREELAPLAEVNVSSLKEFDYFTYAKADGKKTPFNDPTDYWLDFKDSVLTLHFTLPLKAPVKTHALDLEVYDPSYFVDFSFAEKDGFALKGAPTQCTVSTSKPTDPSAIQTQKLGEAMFTDSGANYGAAFANKVAVKCP